MSGSLNRVTLVGNLAADPEIRNTNDGRRIANLRVATSESWKDKQSGEKREKTEFHRVTILNDGLAGVVDQYLNKGSKILIEGQLQTRKWQDQDGNDRYSTEVVVQSFGGNMIMLGGNKGEGQQSNQRADGRPGDRHFDPKVPDFGDQPDDDEIPF